MPLYDIRCLETGKVFERFIPLTNYSDPVICACGSNATRVISSPMFSVDNTGYHSPVTGEWIGSKREHREDLARNNCRILEAGETEAAAKFREKCDQDLENKLDMTVEREIEKMPSEKRERLYNELVHNDIAVERR